MNEQNLGIGISLGLHLLFLLAFLGVSSFSSVPEPVKLDLSFSFDTRANQASYGPGQSKEPAKKSAKLIRKKQVRKKAAPQPEPKKVERKKEPAIVEKAPSEPEVEEKVEEVEEIVEEKVVEAEILNEVEEEEPEEIVEKEEEPQADEPENQSTNFAGMSSEEVGEYYMGKNYGNLSGSIKRQLIYPVLARRMGWAGKVMVSFILNSEGEVSNIKIEKSSGFAVLDKCAIKTIRRITSLPKPPVVAKITVPIVFSLSNS